VNEWPYNKAATRQFGPPDIRPVYPLLDDVYVEKVNYESVSSNKGKLYKKIIGYRPGLRGTEVHGKWKLLVGVAGDIVSPGNEVVIANPRAGIWFRQFRLEFTIDTGNGISHQYSSRKRLYEKTGYVTDRPGKRLIEIVSGSSEWDTGINYVYVEQKDDYGRSIGITDSTSSFYDSFAVFSRITGSLYDRLSVSKRDVFTTYLDNEFGTPYIPISSGSGISPSFDVFDPERAKAARRIVDEIMKPKPLINQQNTLKTHTSRANYAKLTRDIIIEKIDIMDKELSGSF
jgi:hypothetical protein